MKTLKKILLFFVWTWYAWPIGKVLKGLKWLALTFIGKGWLWGKQSKALKAYSKLNLRKGRGWYDLDGGEVWFLIKTRGDRVQREKDFKQFFKVMKPVLLPGDPNDSYELLDYLFAMYVIHGNNMQIRVPSCSEKETLKLLNKLDLYKKQPLTRCFDRAISQCYIWDDGRKYRNVDDW